VRRPNAAAVAAAVVLVMVFVLPVALFPVEVAVLCALFAWADVRLGDRPRPASSSTPWS
jgi:hypothetical protein